MDAPTNRRAAPAVVTSLPHNYTVSKEQDTPTKAAPVIELHRHRLEQAGFATLPIKPFSKQPVCDGWPEKSPAEQWHDATAQYGAGLPINIGVLAGNGRAFLDMDDAESRAAVLQFMAGLTGRHATAGVVVDSASGGGRGHLYIQIKNVPQGQHVYKLSPQVGAGDLRVGRGAYVLAVPSATEKGRYRYARGHRLENLHAAPVFDFRDLQRGLLVATDPKSITITGDTLPVYLPRQALAEWAITLLNLAARAGAGETITLPIIAGKSITWRSYGSRSEAEQAVICHAITRGWQLDDVRDLFDLHTPGHYRAKGRARGRYLAHSYRKGVQAVASVPQRQQVAQLYHAAESRSWPGRGGNTDFYVYRAILTVAYAAAVTEPAVSQRDLETAVSAGRATVRRSVGRLSDDGLITPGRATTAGKAGSFRLNALAHGQAETQRAVDDLPGRVELWAQGKLGRSAGQVWRLLSATPITLAELSRLTGRARRTVSYALERLEREGLAQRTGGAWIVGHGDAAEAAQSWRAPADYAARLRAVDHQRHAYRAYLARKAERTNRPAQVNRAGRSAKGQRVA